MKDQNWIDN